MIAGLLPFDTRSVDDFRPPSIGEYRAVGVQEDDVRGMIDTQYTVFVQNRSVERFLDHEEGAILYRLGRVGGDSKVMDREEFNVAALVLDGIGCLHRTMH